MNNRRRRNTKARRSIGRLLENLRPEGSSLRSRQHTMQRLHDLHRKIRAVFYAPYWY